MPEKKQGTKAKTLIPVERVERGIIIMRGEKVMLDTDLAELYGVSTKRLNEQVKRNLDRFPEDFMFQLTEREKAEVVANCDHLSKLKYSHSMPFAFTEHGAIMVASVLNSPRAVEMSVFVVRAFVRLRSLLGTHKEVIAKITELERKLTTHDRQIMALVEAIKQLMAAPEPARKNRIGFSKDES